MTHPIAIYSQCHSLEGGHVTIEGIIEQFGNFVSLRGGSIHPSSIPCLDILISKKDDVDPFLLHGPFDQLFVVQDGLGPSGNFAAGGTLRGIFAVTAIVAAEQAPVIDLGRLEIEIVLQGRVVPRHVIAVVVRTRVPILPGTPGPQQQSHAKGGPAQHHSGVQLKIQLDQQQYLVEGGGRTAGTRTLFPRFAVAGQGLQFHGRNLLVAVPVAAVCVGHGAVD